MYLCANVPVCSYEKEKIYMCVCPWDACGREDEMPVVGR